MKYYQSSSMKPNNTSMNYFTRLLFFAVGFSIGLMVGLNFIITTIPSSIFKPLSQFSFPPPPSISATPSAPVTLAVLWERFFRGHNGYYSIYVHAHPSYHTPFPNRSVFYGRNIHSQEVKWGTTSMVDAERRLLGNAFLDDPSNQRFVLLSESCIPLFNFDIVYNYLFKTNLSFLDSRDIVGEDGHDRYSQSMSPHVAITQFRKGWQWFEAHRDLALNILLDHNLYGVFNRHCVHPCYSDEHYLPTMAYILYPQMIQNRSLTWVDWSHGGAHPWSYGREDVNVELLTWIKFGSTCMYNGEVMNVCFLFARKFLPNALQPLLQIAPMILGFGY